jgi:hypothetical protein
MSYAHIFENMHITITMIITQEETWKVGDFLVQKFDKKLKT